MKLDITNKAIMASPYLFLNGLNAYYEEFKREHGEPESIVMNDDQKGWYNEAYKNALEVKESTYKGIVIE